MLFVRCSYSKTYTKVYIYTLKKNFLGKNITKMHYTYLGIRYKTNMRSTHNLTF